jgi:transcriptional regulator with XRE-family HTH domain
MPLKQLPPVTDGSFREVLRKARKDAGLSYSELARRAGIHPVMPARYEDKAHSNATLPSLKTWEKLNLALFGAGKTETPQKGGATVDRPLRDAAIDEIVAELKRRGAMSVTINW